MKKIVREAKKGDQCFPRTKSSDHFGNFTYAIIVPNDAALH